MDNGKVKIDYIPLCGGECRMRITAMDADTGTADRIRAPEEYGGLCVTEIEWTGCYFNYGAPDEHKTPNVGGTKTLRVSKTVRRIDITLEINNVRYEAVNVSIEVDAENPYMRVENDMLLSGDGSELLFWCGNGDFFEVPDTVREIGAHAFYGKKNLKEVKLPPSVVTLGFGAFEACNYLGKINLENVKELSESTFGYCDSLKQAELFVKEIPDLAFYHCHNLNGLKLCETERIGYMSFAECWFTRHVNLPPTLVSIGARAFENVGAYNIKLPKSVVSVGEKALGIITDIELYDSLETPASELAAPKSQRAYYKFTVRSAQTEQIKYYIEGYWDAGTRKETRGFFLPFGDFDFDSYDRRLAETLDKLIPNNMFNHAYDAVCCVCARLIFPYKLSDGYKQIYEQYLKKNKAKVIENIMMFNGGTQPFKPMTRRMIYLLCELCLLARYSTDDMLDLCVSKKDAELTAYLLNYKNKRFPIDDLNL